MEFEASCAGRLKLLAHRTQITGGALECCGSHSDPTRWTGAFVRKDGAVLPLRVGEREGVVLECIRLKRAGTPLWNRAKFPPPTVIVDGRAYHFAPGHGRLLIGQVRLERRAVLLAAIGDTLAVIHVAGRTRSVLHVGKPHSFRELDVDQLLRLQGRKKPGSQQAELSGPVRPPPPIEAEHHRIVHGLAVEVGTGPTIAQVLGACFEDVADRARALKAPAPARPKERKASGAGQELGEDLADRAGVLKVSASRRGKEKKAPSAGRVRGKVWVRPVLRYLCQLAIRGHGNIVGRVGEIITLLREHFPDFTITAEAMSDVLGLLHTLGTCLVDPRADGERIWKINLAGLTDPRSALHRRLCRETKGRHLVAAAADFVGTGMPTGIPPSPATGEPNTAGADVVEAPIEVSPDDMAIKAILEELCRLPPQAGSDLLAATLKAASPAVAPDLTGSDTAPFDDPAAALDVPGPAATAAAPAPERRPVDVPDAATAPPVPASAGRHSHAAKDLVTRDVSTPGLDAEEVKVLDELRQLPPTAAQTLLLGSRVYRKRRETAMSQEGNDDATTIVDPWAPPAPPASPRQQLHRGLHLSADTLLLPRIAVVADVPGAARSPPQDGPTHDAVLGPACPVGDSPPGARGPPRRPRGAARRTALRTHRW